MCKRGNHESYRLAMASALATARPCAALNLPGQLVRVPDITKLPHVSTAPFFKIGNVFQAYDGNILKADTETFDGFNNRDAALPRQMLF